MKKLIIATAIILTTGILTSCNREHSIKTTSDLMIRSFLSDKKELASGD